MADTAYSYGSFEELKASCDFDNETMRQLKNMSCANCLPLVMKMLEQARFHEHEGRHDQAFKLYRRSTDICDMVRQKKDFNSFRSTPDARMFHEMFQKSLERLEKAGELVKANYAATQALAFEARSMQEKEIEATQPTKQEEKPTVHSKTLHAIVEKENKQVLVIDFRSDRSSMFRHSNPLFVVVSVDPAILVPGCIMSTLMQSIEVSKRAKLWQLEQYEVVVMVGDDVRSSFVEYRKDSPTSILLSALTSYNTTSKPKKHPVLLEGGFSSWSYAYPMYVSRDQPETRKFFDSKSEFSVLVAKMRELSVVDVEYPDLLPKPKPRPAPRETLESAITPPREASPTPGPIPNSDNDAPSPKIESYTSSEEITNPTTALPDRPAHQMIVSAHETVRPPVQPVIPQVDRSKKPTIYDTSAQAIPSTDAAHKQITNGIHLDQPHLPERNPQPHDADNAHESSMDAKANGSSDQALRSRHEYVPVPTLGGARKDVSGQNRETAIQPAKPRPPAVDRSTKRALTAPQEDTLIRLYQTAMADIIKSGRRGQTRRGHTGLVNMGNTCFMNTTLQALFHTHGLRSVFTRDQFLKHVNAQNNFGTSGVVSACFSALMDCAWSGEFAWLRPRHFLDAFAERVNPELGDGRQHDAQEFLLFLLDALNEDTGRGTHKGFEQNYDGHNIMKDAKDYEARTLRFFSSPVKDEFYVRTVSELKCSVCSTTSVTFEEMSQISLELPSRVTYTSLDDCLTKHFAEVTLDGPSSWNCPTCKQPRRATRNTKIWKLPPVLVVHMKRFTHTGSGFIKNEMEVDFRVSQMGMQRYVHDAAPGQSSSYHLYAVTNHYGTLNSGHYTSCVRNLESNEWVKFDDEHASPVNSSSLMSRNAFILYYRR